jgi:hypothetical protein
MAGMANSEAASIMDVETVRRMALLPRLLGRTLASVSFDPVRSFGKI